MLQRFSRPLVAARRHPAAFACFALAVLCSSCGPNGRKPVYPVQGEVRVDGRPPAHALIGFHPVGDDGPDAVHPVGVVDDRGRFTLTTYRAGDGAPPGEYRVTVAWFLASGRPGDDGPPLNYLPPRFGRAETTPLHAVVEKGRNDLPVFNVQAK